MITERNLQWTAWKRGRVVDCTGLENRQRATVREFESHRFRHRRSAYSVQIHRTRQRIRLKICTYRKSRKSRQLAFNLPGWHQKVRRYDGRYSSGDWFVHGGHGYGERSCRLEDCYGSQRQGDRVASCGRGGAEQFDGVDLVKKVDSIDLRR